MLLIFVGKMDFGICFILHRELESRRSGQVCDRADLIPLVIICYFQSIALNCKCCKFIYFFQGPPDSSPPRLVVGHNVSYDRARVADEYTLRDTGIRYLDTM